MNQDKVHFANALCLEKVDVAKLHRVTEGFAKPYFALKVNSAEVRFALVRADFEKYLTDVP